MIDWEGMILSRQELAEIWEDDPDAAEALGYDEFDEDWEDWQERDNIDDLLDGDLEDQLAALLADADLANQEDREDQQS